MDLELKKPTKDDMQLNRETETCAVVANALDCNIIVREFKLQYGYYVYFWTNSVRNGIYVAHSICLKTFFVQAFKIVVDS